MQIRLKTSLKLLQAHARSIPTEAGYSPQERQWRELLRKIGGLTLEVETQHLFSDQFNTGPIPGISEPGIRAMADMVLEVIGDVRPTAAKCDWCGVCYLEVSDRRIGEICPACNQGGIYRLSSLKPRIPQPVGGSARKELQS
jgi:hypothetical protein